MMSPFLVAITLKCAVEKVFVEESMPDGLQGITKNDMIKYIQYVNSKKQIVIEPNTNSRLKQKLWNKKNCCVKINTKITSPIYIFKYCSIFYN